MQTKIKLLGIAAALASAASLIAGGFLLELGKPSANPEAQAKHAVLVVRSIACVAPEKTTVTATAEGVLNGKRQSIPLKLIPLAGEGVYAQSTFALTRQWPADGNWVITLMQANPNFRGQLGLLVKVNGDRVDWAAVTRLSRAPNAQDIDAALNTVVAAKLK